MKIGGIILSLCDYSGVWSQPYADAGYRVVKVDIQHGSDQSVQALSTLGFVMQFKRGAAF